MQTVGSHPFLAGLAGTVVATAMACLTFLTLYDGRADALDHAQETSRNLVSIISSDLARNVEIYDLSLQSMVDSAQNPSTWLLSDQLRQSVLFDRATTAAYLGGAYVVDASGHVEASQNGELNPAAGSTTGIILSFSNAARPWACLFRIRFARGFGTATCRSG
jgi:hypothetical protein